MIVGKGRRGLTVAKRMTGGGVGRAATVRKIMADCRENDKVEGGGGGKGAVTVRKMMEMGDDCGEKGGREQTLRKMIWKRGREGGGEEKPSS